MFDHAGDLPFETSNKDTLAPLINAAEPTIHTATTAASASVDLDTNRDHSIKQTLFLSALDRAAFLGKFAEANYGTAMELR